ncbi:ParB/RepB/Spo0J family partition protein [Nocardioides sp. P5_C9_2]
MTSTPKPVRRGLGRGLGSLIPTAPPEAPSGAPTSGDRSSANGSSPADVDSPGSPGGRGSDAGHAGDHASSESTSTSNTASSAESADPAPVQVAGSWFAELPITQVRPNARQPRQVFEEEALAELVHSIREVGLLQPVVVRPAGDDSYELIMGERRWRASQEAGLTAIPAIVRDTDDHDMLRDALLENLHRSQLNPLEEAAAYGQLLEDFGCTHDELAQRIGRSRPQISNTLRLLKLSPAVQRRVAAGVLSAGHARALLSVEDADLQDRLASRVTAEGISVRGLEEIVSVGPGQSGSARTQRSRPSAPGLADLAERLSDRFETRVKVDLGKAKGKITVEFASLDDLRRIVEVMDPRNRTDRPI